MMFGHFQSLVSSVGVKTLPVVEMQAATVQSKRLPKAPQWHNLTASRPDLAFTGTQLAHAVIKADFLDYKNPLLPGIGFLLQSHHIIDWGQPVFSLRAGGATVLSDVARSSLTGRLGQGLALLFSHARGFAFTGHLREYLEQQGICTKNRPVADFVCDGRANDRCLVEAKATFADLRNCPSETKSLLKKALNDQVQPWMNKIKPVAGKSFVVASYLRDNADPHSDPSVMAFVDPEGDDEGGELAMSPATIRRENYAAWLTAMGLTAEGDRLRSRQPDGHQVTHFVVFEIGQRQIAFPIDGRVPPREFRMLWPEFWEEFFPYRQTLPAGIDNEALTAVANSVVGGDEALLAYIPREGLDVPGQGDGYAYSVFPDGSFLGGFNGRRPVTFRSVVL